MVHCLLGAPKVSTPRVVKHHLCNIRNPEPIQSCPFSSWKVQTRMPSLRFEIEWLFLKLELQS